MAWQYDPNLSKLEWDVQYLGIATIKGVFKKVQTSLDFDDPDPTHWTVQATVEMASLSSGYDPMDDHVRSPDFLDVERYPTATFTSSRIEGTDGQYRIAGVLDLHGVSRKILLAAAYGGEATDARGRIRRGFRGQATVRRSDFAIPSGVVGGILVAGEDVHLTLHVVATKVE